ncbi:MAG: hypothetical protein Q8Q38_00830 [bacterium]|nr:hypothetical protein [bacterium]MDZ4232047.1 hypothetical protein [Candidatus Pacearchaeota archaeon]
MNKTLRKLIPSFLLPFLRKVRNMRRLYYSWKPFDHAKAQKGELESAQGFMSSDDPLLALLERAEDLRARRLDEYLVREVPYIRDFFRDASSYSEFCEGMEDELCLEVGGGPIGALPLMPWIQKRVAIDPLLDEYRRFQMEILGKTFFTDNIGGYSQNAETLIPELKGRVTGFISCRNALDHYQNPFQVLSNIAEYAAPGCKLLLWTDLWHLDDLDAKHRNLTKDTGEFDRQLVGLGFKIDHRFHDVRDGKETLEYGCIATRQ